MEIYSLTVLKTRSPKPKGQGTLLALPSAEIQPTAWKVFIKMYMNCLAQCLESSKCSINVTYHFHMFFPKNFSVI